MNEIPIVCGGTHYYVQHLLFPPSRLSLDRSNDNDAAASKSKNTKWRPRNSLDEILETLDDPRDETSRCVADRIRTEPGARQYLDTFYLPRPVFPATWLQPPSPSSAPQQPPGKREIESSSKSPRSDQQLLAQHRLLALIDPSEAGRWHWRDGRKVKRALERWWENVEALKRRAREQGKAGKDDGVEVQEMSRPRLRTLMFWVYDDLEALVPRLDRRIDKMVDLGLVDEIKELRELAVRIYGTEDAIDHQEGIFQSIGKSSRFKEFSHIPTDRLVPSDPLFAPALDRMKISTRQYAKRQLQWIRKQLLPVIKQALESQRAEGGEGEDAGPWIYVVRGGDEDVALGEEILRRFWNYEPMPDYRTVGHPKAEELLKILSEPGQGSEGVDLQEVSTIVPDIQQRQVLNARLECNVCSIPGQPVTIIKSEWLAHLKSKSHRRSQARLARENGTAPDWTAVREEAARRKSAKEEERAQLQLEQERDPASRVDMPANRGQTATVMQKA
ncbi:hypothetical protein QFC21_006955 [Naganishia friedmannii]|uniref:Uncharacterized protein n=1 Tax=Naganishia friedmannii TaxID=89922 RepID=A0ACC2UZ32_9TREE|nr:hypothetical protein QFC21_006955 [Naganishia friedmannii]